MKKCISKTITLIALLILSATASGDEITITEIRYAHVPFNEKRDPGNDSLYNAFDNDKYSSALFSDFLISFNMPLKVDELKITNGHNRYYKEFSRLRDVEIILYTTAVNNEEKSDRKTDNKKSEKKLKKENIKNPSNQKDKQSSGNDAIKNDIYIISKSGLTFFKKTEESIPVIGELQDTLAEEPVKPDQNSKIIIEEDNIVKDKNDVRDKAKAESDKLDFEENKTDSDKKKQNSISDQQKKTKVINKKITSPGKIVKTKIIKDGKENKNDDDFSFKKMEGVTKIENDSKGRILINVSLKDIAQEQSIRFGTVYNIISIEFRERDENNYPGSQSELIYVSGLHLLYQGKHLNFGKIEQQKNEYKERFIKSIDKSLSGKVFSAFEGDKEITRILFNKNGKIEIRDKYKCAREGDKDCTSFKMPDMWMLRDGILLMRYNKEWIPWKYEMEYTPEIMAGAENESKTHHWLKLYYKNEKDFSDNFIYLESRGEQKWGWY